MTGSAAVLMMVAVALASCWHAALAQDAQCLDHTMKGTCGACGICCCYKGPLRYMPDEDTCTCKIRYGKSFAVMIAMAVLTIMCSCLSGYYFGGGARLSPYRKYLLDGTATDGRSS